MTRRFIAMRQGISYMVHCVEGFMVLSGFFLGAGSVSGQQVTYSGSAQYATGSYFFEKSTNSFYLTNGIRVADNGVSISLNVPYTIQNTPWLSYSGIGYIPTGGPQNGMVSDMGKGRGKGKGGQGQTRGMASVSTVDEAVPLADTVSYNKYGFSDPNLYLSVRLSPDRATATSLYLNAGVKIPFANPETGFGTGAWDLGAGLSLTQRFGTFFISADAMYWCLGDMQDLNFNDPVSFGLGLGKSWKNGKWLLSGLLTGYTRIIEGYDPPLSLGIGLGHFLTKKITLNANISFGLSESSSDVGGGIGWSVRL